MSVLTDHPSAFDGDAAARGDVDRSQIAILDGAPVIASVQIEPRLGCCPILVDTTTVNGHRAVTLESGHDGCAEPLLPHEALELARAILSRLAVIGFPDDAMTSSNDRVFAKHDLIAGAAA